MAHKLLEDCIDAAPSTNADSWWDLVESHKGALTENPAIFKAGKFILLRLCNSLLKRLSRTRQATLCGRILMFMAAAWPALREKSALNMKGLCHTDNVTEFESADQFDAQNADDDFDDAGRRRAEKRTTTRIRASGPCRSTCRIPLPASRTSRAFLQCRCDLFRSRENSMYA